jgi:hypothetical protein
MILITKFRYTLTFSVITLVFTSFANAQSTATLTGRVTDPSTAVIAGASVVLTNVNTNVNYETVTNDDGIYRITGLLPGVYRANVSKDGFKSLSKADIELHVQDEVSLNFSLQVGSVSESVTVESGEPLLQTQQASLGQVVEGRTVEEMPLNGRNVLNLVTLVPGVVAQGGAMGTPTGTNIFSWGNYQIGGGIANQNAFFIDGAPTNVNYINLTALVPTQDAIQEFKVQTNNMGPEFGRFTGGVINLATKSGTDAFHGSAYEFIRNKVLNANNFFNNFNGQPKPAFTQNQYGVNVGGPIIKDKLFFFFSWEGFALRKGEPFLTTVMTSAELNGDFSAPGLPVITDPTTGKQFDGCNGAGPLNTICPNRLNATSLAVAKLEFPLPNLPGVTNNYTANAKVGGNSNQYNSRIDYDLSNKQRIFGRYTDWTNSNLPTDPFNTGNYYFGLGPEDLHSQQFVFGDTYAFNPTTIADFRLALLRFVYDRTAKSLGTDVTSFGWPASYQSQIAYPSDPGVILTNSLVAIPAVIINDHNYSYSFSPSLTKVIGKHSFKFGIELRRMDFNFVQTNQSSGLFVFAGVFTGFPFSDFVIGMPTTGQAQQPAPTSGRQFYQAYYAGDTFQATRKLTFDYGLRWELPGPWTETHNRLSVFLPDVANSVVPSYEGDLALVDSPEWPQRGNTQAHHDLFAPRLGLAYQLDNKTVVRAGYGIFYIPPDVVFNLSPYGDSLNNATTTESTLLNGTVSTTFDNPFPNGILQPSPRTQAALAGLIGANISAQVPTEPYGYVQQWNLTLQRQLAAGTSFEIAYAGAKGTHLPASGQPGGQQIDVLPDKYLSMGAALQEPVKNPFAAVNGGTVTTGPLAEPTIQQGQLLRTYPQYFGITDIGSFEHDSIYNALNMKLTRRFGRGGTLMVAYTWSKVISNTDTSTSFLETNGGVGGDTGAQDPNDLAAERSLSSFDVPQHLAISYVLDLPVGRGHRYLSQVSGVADKLVSGWGINGVVTMQTGFPLAIAMPAGSTVISSSFGGGTPRPNMVAGCNKSVSGSAPSRINEWFNTVCFVAPNTFGYGDESRVDSTLRAEGINNWDFALFKNTPITERVGLQFRTEFFNLFNRTQFAAPNTTCCSNTNPQFGVVTSQANDPRLVQFALRLIF